MIAAVMCIGVRGHRSSGTGSSAIPHNDPSCFAMPTPAPVPSRPRNIVYGIANLANYIVGAGILGLPFVFSKTGWGVGCFLILLAAFATSLSFDFLLQASTASGCYSYDALALRTGGKLLQKVEEISFESCCAIH